MTEPSISLTELTEKGCDVDVLRQMIQYVSQRLVPEAGKPDGRCRNRRPDLYELPFRSPHPDPLYSSARAPQRRGQTTTRVVGIFPTTRPSFDSLEHCSLNKTTSGNFNVATCSWRDYNCSATINRFVCRLSLNDPVHSLPRTGFIHHRSGRDRECPKARSNNTNRSGSICRGKKFAIWWR